MKLRLGQEQESNQSSEQETQLQIQIMPCYKHKKGRGKSKRGGRNQAHTSRDKKVQKSTDDSDDHSKIEIQAPLAKEKLVSIREPKIKPNYLTKAGGMLTSRARNHAQSFGFPVRSSIKTPRQNTTTQKLQVKT
jgi:hypothetical protein